MWAAGVEGRLSAALTGAARLLRLPRICVLRLLGQLPAAASTTTRPHQGPQPVCPHLYAAARSGASASMPSSTEFHKHCTASIFPLLACAEQGAGGGGARAAWGHGGHGSHGRGPAGEGIAVHTHTWQCCRGRAQDALKAKQPGTRCWHANQPAGTPPGPCSPPGCRAHTPETPRPCTGWGSRRRPYI